MKRIPVNVRVTNQVGWVANDPAFEIKVREMWDMYMDIGDLCGTINKKLNKDFQSDLDSIRRCNSIWTRWMAAGGKGNILWDTNKEYECLIDTIPAIFKLTKEMIKALPKYPKVYIPDEMYKFKQLREKWAILEPLAKEVKDKFDKDKEGILDKLRKLGSLILVITIAGSTLYVLSKIGILGLVAKKIRSRSEERNENY